MKGGRIPGYLRKGWTKNRWNSVARFRMGEGVRKEMYWGREEDRRCRIYGGKEETWEHVWEECGRWGARGSWQEMVETVLGEDGEGEEWLRKLECFRNGDRGWRAGGVGRAGGKGGRKSEGERMRK